MNQGQLRSKKADELIEAEHGKKPNYTKIFKSNKKKGNVNSQVNDQKTFLYKKRFSSSRVSL